MRSTRLRFPLGVFILGVLSCTAPASAGMTLAAPADGGVVLGHEVVVDVRECHCKAGELDARLDGEKVRLDWSHGPYPHQWLAQLALPGPGQHLLELTGACKASSRFQAFDRDAAAIGQAVAAHFLRDHAPESLGWDWGPAVFLYGLSKLEPESPALSAFYRHWASRGVAVPDHADTCAPALGALALERATGDAVAHATAATVAHYLATEPRNELGAIDHLGHWILRFVFPRGIWVDSLEMTAVFATQWGRATGDDALRDFGAAQPIIYASVLQDARTGLFRHAFDFRAPVRTREAVPHSDTFWLRGNGWVVASIVDILDELPFDHPARGELVRILNRVVEGLARFQQPTGLWDTLANLPGLSYGETSGTALVAYAVAKGVHRGWIPEDRLELAKRAFAGVTSRLKPASRATGEGLPLLSLPRVSGATNPGSQLYYRMVPTYSDLPYGVGAYLMAAAEMAGEIF